MLGGGGYKTRHLPSTGMLTKWKLRTATFMGLHLHKGLQASQPSGGEPQMLLLCISRPYSFVQHLQHKLCAVRHWLNALNQSSLFCATVAHLTNDFKAVLYRRVRFQLDT